METRRTRRNLKTGEIARRLLVAGLLVLGEPAVSQPGIGPPRLVRFSVFAAEPIEGLGYASPTGADAQPLRFYPTARSPTLEHRGRQPLRLVHLATARNVATVAIPEEIRQALLLVSPGSAGPGTASYRVTVIDDGPGQRGAGQIQVLDLSGLNLVGELNGGRLDLATGLNPAVTAGRTARLVLRVEFRGRSYLSWHDTIELGPTGRALVILFPPFLPGSLEVQTRVLRDEPPPAAVPER
jgi:hypothetical protein